jgi:protein-S-isoprenylcysteine O-methyltransferase Ste14
MYISSVDLITLIGILISAISFVLVLVSRVQLGKAFAVTPQAKDLVTHGLYSKLQNPMYVFLDLTIIGIALAVQRWYVLVILVILVPLQVRNSRKERSVLSQKFGERYEVYRRSTWF